MPTQLPCGLIKISLAQNGFRGKMTKSTRLFFLFSSLLFVSGFGPCSSQVSGPVKFGGYVRDIVSMGILTNYTMTVESAEALTTVDVDETGKFNFSTPVGADYVVTVTADGYRTFTSSNRWIAPSDANQSQEVNEHLQFLYNVPLIPASITSPALSVKVLDNQGNNLADGAYRIVSTGVISGFASGLYDDGVTTTGVRWWAADFAALGATLTDGTIEVDENILLPGYNYEILVYGSNGNRDQRTSLTLSTSTINKTQYLSVVMVPMVQPGAPKIIGQSHVGPDGTTPKQIGGTRSIEITFDRDILLYKDGLKNKGTDDLLALTGVTDNDGDSILTADLIADGTDGAGTYSSRITFTASGNKLTITLAADTSIITTIDTDDDLAYTLDATLVQTGVKVKDANSQYDSWTALSALSGPAFQPVILIRGSY